VAVSVFGWLTRTSSSGIPPRQHTGTPFDIDGDALFFAWEQVPAELPFLDNPAGSILWLSVVSIALPVVYFLSLINCFIGHPSANLKEARRRKIVVLHTAPVNSSPHHSSPDRLMLLDSLSPGMASFGGIVANSRLPPAAATVLCVPAMRGISGHRSDCRGIEDCGTTWRRKSPHLSWAINCVLDGPVGTPTDGILGCPGMQRLLPHISLSLLCAARFTMFALR